MSIVKEFVEKLVERLEYEKYNGEFKNNVGFVTGTTNAIRIVNQLAEEYNYSKNSSSSKANQIADDLSAVLKEAKSMGCKEVKYFHHIPLENVEIVVNALRAYNQGWIPCKEKMPKEAEDVILTFRNSAGTFVDMATCIRGKFYYISDVDGNYYEEEFKEPIAWMPLPDPYKPEQKEIPTKHYEERFNRVV